MAKLTIGQKAVRVLGFLLGLRNRRVARVLAAHGLTEADVADGWARLAALTKGRLGAPASAADADPALVAKLDLFENKWFPILSASLLARFPKAHDKIFRNLSQTEGVEVLITVGTLLERIDALGTTGEDAEVRALIERRGLSQVLIDEAKRLLKEAGTLDTSPDDPSIVSPEEDALLDERLWAWYREWSTIARAVITDRRSLRALGFLSDRGTAVGDDEAEDEEEEDTEEEPASPRARATNGGPAIPPGMPGSDPFLEEEEEEPPHNA